MQWFIKLISRMTAKVYTLILMGYYGKTPLHCAARNNKPAVVARLLRLPVGERPDVNARDNSGNTPLHCAARNGHTDIVEQLLNLPVDTRPDVNARNNYNDTPLHCAAWNGHAAVIEQLLRLPVAERPNVNAGNHDGYTPLHCAARNGHTGIVAQLLNLPVGERPNVNAGNKSSDTPLHMAAELGNTNIVAQLLNLPIGERPDVNAGNKSSDTPLHLAARNGRSDVVAQLLNLPVGERPNLNASDNYGNTPLHLAALGHTDIVAQLLNLPIGERPDVNARNNSGNTPLHHAARNNKPAVVAQLLRLPVGERPDVNASDIDGDTPLHCAARNGHTDIVEQLLNLPVGERPDVNAVNRRGATPIQVAFEQGRPEIVALLQRYGATLPARLRVRDAAVNNAQSIHTASTHESVSESATKLLRRYRDKKIDAAKETLCAWVLSQTDTDIKTLAAKAAIGTYGNLDYVDPRSNVTFKQAFGLIWLGINDVNAIVDKTLTEEDLNARKKTLIEHLYRMQRGYNLNAKGEDMGGADRPICGSGGFSTLINTLAGGHQDVTFVYITPETISLKAGAILTECIKAISPETKNKYLKEAKEEELPKEILAIIKQEIEKKLNDEFLGCKGLPPHYATLVDGFLKNLKYHPEINKLAQELSEKQKSEALPSVEVDIDDAAAEEASRPRKRARV